MDWTPTLADRSGPAYLRIVDALAEDIASGRLRRGQQLPTHRALAGRLGLDLTTVTRAYAEARRRGLTAAHVGQGTFVAESQLQAHAVRAPEPAFDLSMNLPPQPAHADLEGRIARGIAALQRAAELAGCLNYSEPGGRPDDRALAAEWLRPRLPAARGDRIAICPGTQNALLCLLMTLASPGDTILTETLTYPGIRAAASLVGVRLVGVATDAEGPLADALQAAISEHRPKALYLIPTIHNPTTVTMSPRRRSVIAESLARHRLPLIEDDVYGLLEPEAVPIAALIPELAWLTASLSKCVAPGLRVAFVHGPSPEAVTRLADAVRASAQMSTGLTLALVLRWIADGSTDAIIAAIREEATERQKLAAKALAGHSFSARPGGHHLWLPLPHPWTRLEFAAHIQRLGLGLVTSDAFAVKEPAPHAVRVALGAAKSRHELVSALGVLAASLRAPAVGSRII